MLIAAVVVTIVSISSTVYWLERSCFESTRFVPATLLSLAASAAALATVMAIDVAP